MIMIAYESKDEQSQCDVAENNKVSILKEDTDNCLCIFLLSQCSLLTTV